MKILFEKNAKLYTFSIFEFLHCFPFITKINFYMYYFGIQQKKQKVKVLEFVFLKLKMATY